MCLLAGSRSHREVAGGGSSVGRITKAAVTCWCPRPLEPPCPEAPVGRVACAPSEPQGPCLPAGPPELLLRLVGEEDAAHMHTLHARWKCCKWPSVTVRCRPSAGPSNCGPESGRLPWLTPGRGRCACPRWP